MRLDKFLKVSRIIKRRTVANEACSGGRVSINGRVAKPAADVKEGDQLEIRFGNRVGKYQILSVKETVRKENAQDMYQVLEEDAQTKAERSVGE
ncbi:MAG: RNA-binding S4 domain-containing protein [Candidatus Limiplasma sp.]|nr:RNA-binding S4 domain-containing protein [Clostridiales bacterium]MDY3242601.1 RNA-binding S4 domain-containing protein [Candidatus Limiplasma sp.]MDY4061816.1 RNA-binding S4 domain-containing protein [Candidatus Limiplasma sp.]